MVDKGILNGILMIYGDMCVFLTNDMCRFNRFTNNNSDVKGWLGYIGIMLALVPSNQIWLAGKWSCTWLDDVPRELNLHWLQGFPLLCLMTPEGSMVKCYRLLYWFMMLHLQGGMDGMDGMDGWY